MGRMIDADALDVVGTIIPSDADTKSYIMGMEYILNKIDNMPTIEERKTGKWVGVKEYCDHLNEEAEREGKRNRYMPSGMNISVYCDQCWKPNDRRTTYCPNCGKRMVQGVEKDGLH